MKEFNLNDIPTSEIDYGTLIGCMKNYRFPRNKINKLLKSGKLIRVKKGIYVKGSGEPHAPACLANMIYGPSYISKQYALSYYGLIPEHVYMVTSMTTGKSKRFHTPVGDFDYETIDKKRYSVGIKCEALDPQRNYLIATPEKAIVDLIYKNKFIKTEEDLREYLLVDLRLAIGKNDFRFSINRLRKIASVFNIKLIHNLVEIVRQEQKL